MVVLHPCFIQNTQNSTIYTDPRQIHETDITNLNFRRVLFLPLRQFLFVALPQFNQAFLALLLLWFKKLLKYQKQNKLHVKLQVIPQDNI